MGEGEEAVDDHLLGAQQLARIPRRLEDGLAAVDGEHDDVQVDAALLCGLRDHRVLTFGQAPHGLMVLCGARITDPPEEAPNPLSALAAPTLTGRLVALHRCSPQSRTGNSQGMALSVL